MLLNWKKNYKWVCTFCRHTGEKHFHDIDKIMDRNNPNKIMSVGARCKSCKNFMSIYMK